MHTNTSPMKVEQSAVHSRIADNEHLANHSETVFFIIYSLA